MARGAVLDSGTIDLRFTEYNTAVGASSSTSSAVHSFIKSIAHPSGTSDGSIDRVYSVVISATGTPATIDVSGSLAGELNAGATEVFADLQWVICENTSASNNLLIGGGSTPVGITNGTTDYIVVTPGGFFVSYLGTSGLAVGAASTDLLRYAASSGTVAGKVWLIGRSA